MPPSWSRIRERKLVQWGVAYLAGAWLLLQILALLSDSYQWPAGIMRLAPVVLAFGLLAVLVLAWYHGERGLQRATGVELLILAGLLVLGGAAVAILGRGSRPAEPDVAAVAQIPSDGRSIAVLPFENLSVDPENAYFTDGMTEEITLALSKVPELRVVSRTSSSQYAGSDKSIREIAGELGVATVLEGSVRRSGTRVRITAQLIDARTDEHLWSANYDREVADVFEIQSEIAERISEELQASFTEAEQRRILAGSTRDVVAHDLYLRAVRLIGPTDAGMEEVDAAMELLRQAVRRDPSFGLAWEALFIVHQWSISWRGPAAADSARAALNRALVLAPDSRAKVLESARAWFVEKDREGSIELALQAAELAPSDPEIVGMLAAHYLWNGDLAGAVEWGERLVALDPRTAPAYGPLIDAYMELELDDRAETTIRRLMRIAPQAADGWIALGKLRLRQGRYAEAVAAADSALLRNPVEARSIRGLALLWGGDPHAAVADLETFVREGHDERGPLMAPSLAYAHRMTGDAARAEAALQGTDQWAEAALQTGWNPPLIQYTVAGLVAASGDRDRAIRELQKYVDAGGRDARLVAGDPVLGPLRDDPRYSAIVEDLRARLAQARSQVPR